MLIKERGSIYNAGGEHSSTKKQVRKEKAAYHDYPGRKKSSQLPEHFQKARRQHAELTNFVDNLERTGSAQRIVKLLLSYQTSYYKQKNSDKVDCEAYINRRFPFLVDPGFAQVVNQRAGCPFHNIVFTGCKITFKSLLRQDEIRCKSMS